MPLYVILILALLGLTLTWFVYTLLWGKPPFFNLAVERLTLRMVLKDPEILSSLGLLDNTPLDFHSGNLTDASTRYMDQLRQLDRDGLALMRRYDPQQLSGQKRLTHQLMRWYYEQNLRGHRFDYHWIANPVFMGPYPVNHVFGVQVDLINFLCNDHKIKGRRSVKRYLARLKRVPWKLAGLRDSLEQREELGAVPPRFVIEKSLQQIEDFLAQPIEDNPLYASLQERLEESGRFSPAAQARWGERAKAVIEQAVLPAYRGLSTYLQGSIERALEGDGLWGLPEGLAYYEFLLRNHTTTDLSAEAVHQLGLDEVARLTEEVREVLVGLDLTAETPGETLAQLMADPQFHFSGEGARQEIIEAYQGILDEVNARLPGLFKGGALDKITVKRLPEYKEPDSPIAYAQPPSMDGGRPGTMWLNLRDPGNIYRWGMRTLAYHEGIPGHVYQMAYAQKIKGLPTFRRAYFVNAYIEGWALYAERIGWELGLEDDYSNLGRLQALLWRAARLVVDTGIHTKGWTREEAIAYMTTITGLPERDVITEVERYIVMPGQACAYYIGYLKMLELRQKAQSVLGEAFDLKDFHEVLLGSGGLPLALLEEAVDAYIDRVAGLG
jgi:uncharacterized protein (DUF885 family)